MTPARIPARSSSRRPAAVVPPGDVTWPRSWAGCSSDSDKQPGRADQELLGQRGGDVARQPGGDPAVDQGLGHQEDVGRTRTR